MILQTIGFVLKPFSLLAGAVISKRASSQLPTLVQLLNQTAQLSELVNLAAPYLASLTSAAAASGRNITFLAPNNAAVGAFLNSSAGAQAATNQALVSALLSYHVLVGNWSTFLNASFIPSFLQPDPYANVTNGQRVYGIPGEPNTSFVSGFLQNSTVNGSVLQFQGGSLYVVNQFLTLPQNLTATAVASNLTAAVGALSDLSLTSTLNSRSDLTFFLPNNAAFQSIAGILANLSVADLTDVLEYHVIAAGTPLYTSLLFQDGITFPAIQGVNITYHINNGTSYVNNAKIIVPDILVSNGVIHIIDEVLNPADSLATSGVAFRSPTAGSDVPFTSGVPTPTSIITAITLQASASSAGNKGTSATPTSGSTSSSPSASGSTSGSMSGGISTSSGSHTDVGAIAGGVVGGVVGLILVVLLIWWCRRKGYSLSVKLDQKPKQRDPSTAETPVPATAAYSGKSELSGNTGSVITRKELPNSARNLQEAPSSVARVPTTSTELSGTEKSSELPTQVDRSNSARFREVESGFGPVDAEYAQWTNRHSGH